MSQIPPQYPQQPGMPPQGVPYAGGYTMQPKAGNAWGIVSLISSLIGFCTFGVGGLLGVIFGIIGILKAKRVKAGMGLSVAGLLIGIVSIGMWALFSGAILAVFSATQPNRDAAKAFINDVSAGNLQAAKDKTDGSITSPELEDLSGEMKKLGTVTDVTTLSANAVNDKADLAGIISFGPTKEGFEMKQVKSGGAWKVSYFKITTAGPTTSSSTP